MGHTSSGGLAKLQSVPREVTRWQKAQQQLMGGRYSHALAGYRDLVERHPEIYSCGSSWAWLPAVILIFPSPTRPFKPAFPWRAMMFHSLFLSASNTSACANWIVPGNVSNAPSPLIPLPCMRV